MKLVATAALLAAAVVLYFILSPRDEPPPAGAISVTYWYCTQANKGFELAGENSIRLVKTVRPSPGNAPDGAPIARRAGEASVIVALSPYSHDYTGVPARRCADCGDVFPAMKDGRPAVCPGCNWDPATGKKAEPVQPAIGD